MTTQSLRDSKHKKSDLQTTSWNRNKSKQETKEQLVSYFLLSELIRGKYSSSGTIFYPGASCWVPIFYPKFTIFRMPSARIYPKFTIFRAPSARIYPKFTILRAFGAHLPYIHRFFARLRRAVLNVPIFYPNVPIF